MSNTNATRLVIAALVIITFVQGHHAQGLSASSLRSTSPVEIDRDAGRVQAIIDQAEGHFKLGELNLRERDYNVARAEFDKAIDAVLESGMDVRSNPKLQTYYLQLVERVSRFERPTQTAAPLVKQQPFVPRASDVPVLPPPCTSDDAARVALRGLRLGMTVAQAKAVLPELMVVPPDKLGRSNASIRFYKLPKTPAGFAGVRAMFFDFLDGRVTNISSFYDHSADWTDSRQFAGTLAEQFKLPDDWENYQPNEPSIVGPLKVLNCGGIQIIAGLISASGQSAPTITLNDTHAERVLVQKAQDEAERLRKLDEQRRKAFKP